MIFTELTLHNFGPFNGTHAINLAPPSRNRPVILIGGMNGAGKTTLLDALNLALYGKRANCSKRQDRPYSDFLAESVHRGASPHEGAGVELAFRRFERGKEVSYCVKRTWSARASVARDQVEVLRDGRPDALLTENWNDQVEDFIPRGIADLFLFDGEKIEQLADISNSKSVLQSALQSLLGLGLVEQLESDLVALERRKKLESKPSEEKERVQEQERRLEQLRLEKTRLFERLASSRVELEQAQKQLADVEVRLRAEGGQLFDRQSEIESDLEVARGKLTWLEEGIRDLAAGALPLALVGPLLEEIAQISSEGGQGIPQLVALLEGRDHEILKRAGERGFTRAHVDRLRRLFEEDREARSRGYETSASNAFTPEVVSQVNSLLKDVLPDAKEQANRHVEAFLQARRHAEDLERYKAAIPHREAIAGLLAERDDVLRAVALAELTLKSLEEQSVTVEREIVRVESWLQAAYEDHAKELNAQEDSERVVASARKTRQILKTFRERLISRHTGRLSGLVLDSFRQLLRKERLVSDLRIDPKTLAVELIDANGDPIAPDRLSAGERQLLAVSLLWGLAKASGRPLPTVIDTPMGRLDSSHRDHLVERYFPKASHQVLLLSTDQEIFGGYFDRLSPFIGRTYQLVHDERRRETVICEGYFR